MDYLFLNTENYQEGVPIMIQSTALDVVRVATGTRAMKQLQSRVCVTDFMRKITNSTQMKIKLL